MNICPKHSTAGDPLSGGHRMRLEKSDGHREVWKCVLCGFTRIETRDARCRSCGGFKHEAAPWWCTKKEQHS